MYTASRNLTELNSLGLDDILQSKYIEYTVHRFHSFSNPLFKHEDEDEF